MSLHVRIHKAGIWILVLGIATAVVIYISAVSGAPALDLPNFTQDRRFNYELERLGGKAAVYLAAFNYWFASLWHGTNLAFTVAALALFAALVCFWLARFLSYPELSDSVLQQRETGWSAIQPDEQPK